jgi:Na+/proline symporter
MNIFPSPTIGGIIGFVLGFAAASLGFDLGEPHLVARYLAGSSPKETQGAWWIYIGFVQFTWIAMQVFGILLRGVMPGITEPEAGVSIYFQHHVNAIITGLVIADVFATIAATSNSLLVAMSQAVVHDLIPAVTKREMRSMPLGLVSLIIGGLTMLLSLAMGGSVASIALSSISILGSGLGPAVMIKTMKWRHTGTSLVISIITGIIAAISWKIAGLADITNEATVGIATGLITNMLVMALSKKN